MHDEKAQDAGASDSIESFEELLRGVERTPYNARFFEIMEEAEAERRKRERLRRLRELATPAARRQARSSGIGRSGNTGPPIAVRLPRWLTEQVRREFESLETTPSAGVRQILEEWWVMRRYPALEYRDRAFDRLAAVRGGPEIVDWLTGEASEELPPEVREQVFDYVELFRVRIEVKIGRSL